MVPLQLRLVKRFVVPLQCGMEKPKRPRGRQPKPEGEKLVRVTLYLHPETVPKIEKEGGREWAREVLKRAKAPK